jgi:Arc/MetJ-type ribon-helix-helix transcriptional regulator
MANLTVTLPADLEAWVETQAQTTEFPSADAYLASLIRHDQERR